MVGPQCVKRSLYMQIHKNNLGSENELRGWVSDNLANTSEALGGSQLMDTWAEEALDICSNAYPPNSTAVAYQKLRLARLIPEADSVLSASLRSQMFREAVQTLSMHFGDSLEL